VRIVVKDTGVGMDTETVARIFEPFFTTKDVGKGTGLGLSTVFAVVRQLGGKIGVDSEPGRGTTFTLWFPAVERAIARAPAAPIALPRFRGTALVVEDEPLVRLTVAHYLQELGLDVSTAEDANEAMRVCDEHQGSLDLLVCDIVLPVMRGPDLAELVRARYPGLRMLFMSATLESEGRFASDRGDAPVLVKPFGLEDLARALESLPDPPSRRPDEDHAPNPGARAPESTTVLLVEDQEASRLAIGDLLETEGYRTLVAESAEAALQHADQPLHVLLTDVHLPDMPGNALAERLRRDHPDLRVIFMSGDTHPPDGATEFVQKPIHLDALLDLLAHDPPRAPTGLPRGRERC
jgi:CheY-like chemotaxis protein